VIRLGLAVGILGLSTAVLAQSPDVIIKTDLRLVYASERGGANSVRWYDIMGRYSTVSLSFTLEPGFKALVSERLQALEHTGDSELLDEYYIEDPGNWRLGKQYLPFGRGVLLREAGRAARGETSLFLEGLPVVLALCDSGPGQPRGAVGRIGGRIGISAAVGEHFATSASALTPIRRPEDAPGKGEGYRLIVGADFSKRLGSVMVQGEFASLRQGEGSRSPETDVSDLSFSIKPRPLTFVTVAWSRNWGSHTDFFRLEGSLPVYRGIALEPIVRMRGSSFWLGSVALRMKF